MGFKRFDPEDFVVSSDAVTSTVWSGFAPSLNTYHTSSTQKEGTSGPYYLNVYHGNGKIYLQFTLDLEIPNNKIKELLILINTANQNSKEGFFVFDFKLCKINFNLISPYSVKTEESSLDDFLKIKLDFTKSLFHNFVSGVHNLFYGEKIESASLELLFLNNEGCA